MTDYYYTQVSGGYRWNMVQRIRETVGIEPFTTLDTQLDGINRTVISFINDLTTGQKFQLDGIMSGNPTLPPTPTGTRFKIDDIYEKLGTFRTTTNVNWKLYFSQSAPPTGRVDTIELHSPTVLNTTQKNNTKTAFAALIKEL